MSQNPEFPEDLATFSEEILNGKLHFFFFFCAEKFQSTVLKFSSRSVSVSTLFVMKF